MRELSVGKNDAGQRLDRFLRKAVPGLPDSRLQKYIRTKDIKINGRPAKGDVRLAEGDTVRLYIPDEFFNSAAPKRQVPASKVPLKIAYEDENILIADKQPGLLCHDAEGWSPNTLISAIQAYLREKGEWDPGKENSFAPALCNRIDRNTGGLVIAAKNAEALRIMDEKIRDREIEKTYLCAVVGRPKPSEGRLENQLFKDAQKNQVFLYKTPRPGTVTAITEYRVLCSNAGLSLVECRLITGRTHQIRAQMSYAGWPLLGDGKYGNERKNREYGEKRQALQSYRMKFAFTTESGVLSYLNGLTVTGSFPAFADRYFPDRGNAEI